jgi:hypothetical protein
MSQQPKKEAASWRVHEPLTARARELFGQFGPTVNADTRRQQHFQITNSPLGRVEAIGLKAGFLVAAESPPPPLIDANVLPARIKQRLDLSGLTAWGLVESSDFAEVLRVLADEQPKGETTVPSPWCPHVTPLPPAPPLIGEARLGLVDQLDALLAAQPSATSVIALCGVDGIGKRTAIAHAARRAGLRLNGELPLRRFFYDGVLELGLEKAANILQACRETLGPEDLLVLSDAHLFSVAMPASSIAVRNQILFREMARLPCRIVLTSPIAWFRASHVISLPCPGLASIRELEELLRGTYPPDSICLEHPALELLARAARVDGQGIVPGRVLYLVELAKAMLSRPDTETGAPSVGEQASPRTPASRLLAPDEIMAAWNLARRGWMSNKKSRGEAV